MIGEIAEELSSLLCQKGKCYNTIVDENISDTRPEIAALQRRLLRQVGPARKLAMLGEMNQTVKVLALSGLRSRYPTESPEMLRRLLADLVLGPDLARLAYGPINNFTQSVQIGN